MARPRSTPFLPAAAAILLFAAPQAVAEGPVHGPEGQEDIREIAARITRALKANEASLARLARGEKAAAGPVDIRLPEDCGDCKNGASMPAGGSCESCGRGSASSGSAAPTGGGNGASEGMAELLRAVKGQGGAILSGIDDLLAQARTGSPSGDGSGQPQPGSGSGGKGDEPSPEKKDQEGKQDPKPGDGEEKPKTDEEGKPKGDKPEDGRESRDPADPSARPPRSDRDPPSEEDLKSAFFARLPAKVREAVDNGDFDKVPEKYRALVAEWTRILAEKDAEDARKGN